MMAKMSASGAMTMLVQAWQALVTHLNDEKADRQNQAQLAENADKINDFLKHKSDGAKRMLQSMASATDSGLLTEVLKIWVQVVDEAKKEAQLTAALHAQQSKLAGFSSRGKEQGMSACDRARYEQELYLMIMSFDMWKLDMKMEDRMRTHHSKVDAKRQQLTGVQTMFRQFAVQLESGIKGSDTSRGPGRLAKQPTKSMDDLALPTLQKSASAGGSQKRGSRNRPSSGQTASASAATPKMSANDSAAYPGEGFVPQPQMAWT